MHHGVPRSSPTPTTDQRADAGQEPGSTPATTVPAATVPTTTAPPAPPAPSTPAPTTTAAPTTTVVAVVDVAGPPVPAAFQQFGVGGSGSSSATSGSSSASSSVTAVVAAKGPLPSQTLPATGAPTFEAAGVAMLLLVVGLVAVRVSQASRRRRERVGVAPSTRSEAPTVV